jgi:hypothetical protein
VTSGQIKWSRMSRAERRVVIEIEVRAAELSMLIDCDDDSAPSRSSKGVTKDEHRGWVWHNWMSLMPRHAPSPHSPAKLAGWLAREIQVLRMHDKEITTLMKKEKEAAEKWREELEYRTSRPG